MKQLLLFAHPLEAAPTIEALRAEPLGERLYQYEGGIIAISGMGCLAAACTVTQLAGAVDEVINLGLAGSLSDEIEPESFHWASSVSKYIPNQTARLDAHPTLGNGGIHLLSSDAPIYDKRLRDQLDFDLVDMEGYGVAMAAERVGLPWKLGKIVSDTASEEGWRELKARLPELARQLALSPTSV